MARKVPTIPTPPGTKSPVPGLDRLRRRPPGSRIEETISEETEEKRERRTRQIPGVPGVVAPPPQRPAPGAVVTRLRALPDIRFEEPPDELREEEPAEPLEAAAPPDPSTWVWKDTLKYAFLKGLISQEQLTNYSAALSTVAAGGDWNIAPSPTYPSGAGVLPAWQALLTRVLGMVGTEYGREARNALAAVFGGSNLPQMPDITFAEPEPITEEGGEPEAGAEPGAQAPFIETAANLLLGPDWRQKYGTRFSPEQILLSANANDFVRFYAAFEAGKISLEDFYSTLDLWRRLSKTGDVLPTPPAPPETSLETIRALQLGGMLGAPGAAGAGVVTPPGTTAQPGGPELLTEYQTALNYASQGPDLAPAQTLDEKVAAIQTWQAERSTIVSLDTPPPGIEYDAINKVFVNQATGGDLTPEQYRLLGQWERAQRVDEQMTSLLSALLQSYGRLQENQLLMQQDQDALTNALKTGEIDSAAEMQFRLDEARLQNERLEQSRWALEVTLTIMRDPQTWYMAKQMGLLQYLMGQVQGLPGMAGFSLEPPPKASRMTVLRMLPSADVRRGLSESEWQAALYAIAAATGWTANDLIGLLERHKPGSLGPGAATPIFRTREARP